MSTLEKTDEIQGFYNWLPSTYQDFLIFIMDEVRTEYERSIDQIKTRIEELEKRIEKGNRVLESKQNSQDTVKQILDFTSKYAKLPECGDITLLEDFLLNRDSDLEQTIQELKVHELKEKKTKLVELKQRLGERKNSAESFYQRLNGKNGSNA